MKKKKRKKKRISEIVIPPKIKEIISYLSYSFSRNNLLDRKDLQQDLYVIYLEMLKKNPKCIKNKPGYFFVKFKWYLLTKYSKEIKRINKEWEYIVSTGHYDRKYRNDLLKSGQISDSK